MNRLPYEIRCIILSYIDLEDKINWYNSSDALREYFGDGFRLRSVVLSGSSLSTVQTLEEKMFADFKHEVQELVLSGVEDLTVDNLIPHLKRFENLRRLDITYTNIYSEDIQEICPDTLRSIGINFRFRDLTLLTDQGVPYSTQWILFFKKKHFEDIHFIIYSWDELPATFKCLEQTYTEDLKLTILDTTFGLLYEEELFYRATNATNFNKITIKTNNYYRHIHYIDGGYMTSDQLLSVLGLNFDQLEYIFVMYTKNNNIVVNVSPILSRLFKVSGTNFTVQVLPQLSRNFEINGNIQLQAWNKGATTFDDYFFRHLRKELKNYFPTYICTHCQTEVKIIDSPNDWYSIDGCEGIETILETVTPAHITLSDYCRGVGRIVTCRPIGISQQAKGLHNLTYLQINNLPITKDFFSVLFTKCPVLTTLVIGTSLNRDVRHYMIPLSKCIHLAKLKNFMMITDEFEIDIIFETLSRCPSMENVYVNMWIDDSEVGNVDASSVVHFIETCRKLYSLVIEHTAYSKSLNLLLLTLKFTALRLRRKHLRIQVGRHLNPFNIDVFSPSSLNIFWAPPSLL